MPNKTLRDIAIEIGINVNTLRSRIYRAQHSTPRAGKRRTESSKRQHGWKPGGNGYGLGDHCPKCGGPVDHSGGVVLSRSAKIDRCIMCGLTSESMSFYDAVNCRRVDIKTALLQGWQMGAPGLSDQGLFDILQKREVVASDATLEEEQARIAAKGPRMPDMGVE